MKITKETIQLYKIREVGEMGWADISIDEGEQCGRISIASDWGNWQYFWGACGCPFKEFLVHLKKDIHYTANKFGAANWFDLDKTIEQIKREILNYRRLHEITAEKARTLYVEIKEIESECTNSIHHFYAVFHASETLSAWYDEIPTHTGIEPSFKVFWEKAYLPFCDELQKELQKELNHAKAEAV